MYCPTVSQRYGGQAILRSFNTLRKGFRQGVGISVNLYGSPAAGAIVHKDGSTLCGDWMGLLGGNRELVHRGVYQGIYYHVLLTAHNWGCSEINFGRSRPFMSDGVLKYKLKWGSQAMLEDPGTGAFAISVSRQTEATREFLRMHRFYTFTFTNKQSPETEERFERHRLTVMWRAGQC
jgi:hypothetical protein